MSIQRSPVWHRHHATPSGIAEDSLSQSPGPPNSNQGARLLHRSDSFSENQTNLSPDVLQLFLLGGFHAVFRGKAAPNIVWQRPSAKALVKILALEPNHRLHREQLQDILWPSLEPSSAASSLRKALHLARHALEPDLPRRGISTYLDLVNDIVSLNSEATWIDVDHFSRLANHALAGRDISAFQNAISVYNGELLPEDRYEDWADEPRSTYTGLYIRLLTALSDLYKERGAYDTAIQWLQQVAHLEPTREEVHRSLMILYTSLGDRQSALRQYTLCCDVLMRELDAEPALETSHLYEEIVANRIPAAVGTKNMQSTGNRPSLPVAMRRSPRTSFIGRQEAMDTILDDLAQATNCSADRTHIVFVTGEPGMGKSRLLAEIGQRANEAGCLVLSGSGDIVPEMPSYSPFVELLDGYLSLQPLADLEQLASTYPELARYVPALAISQGTSPGNSDPPDTSSMFAAMVHLLTDLASARTVLIILDDLHMMSTESVQLLHYLVRVSAQRNWLIVGSYRREEVAANSPLHHLITAYDRAGVSHAVGLRPLDREACDDLVLSLLPDYIPNVEDLGTLYELARGNPLFIQALVEIMRETGTVSQLVKSDGTLNGVSSAVVWQIRDLVDIHLERLGPQTRQILTLLAVGGTHATFETLCYMVGSVCTPPRTLESVLEALDKALDAQILERQGDVYVFRHPIYRMVICESLSHHRRVHVRRQVEEAFQKIESQMSDALSMQFG